MGHTQTNFKGKRLSLSPKANSDCHIPCIETFLVPFNSLFRVSFNDQDVRHQSYWPPGDGSRRSGFGCRWRCSWGGRLIWQAWPFYDGDDPFGDCGRFLSGRCHSRSHRLEDVQLAASRLKQFEMHAHSVRVQQWWSTRFRGGHARALHLRQSSHAWTSKKSRLILTIVIIVSSSSLLASIQSNSFSMSKMKKKKYPLLYLHEHETQVVLSRSSTDRITPFR